MILFYTLIYIYLLLRPYYFFNSGSIQISDMFLIAAFVVFIFITHKDRQLLLKNIKKNSRYGLFLLFVIFINTTYSIIYSRSDFMHYSLFYIFNFMVIILFSFLLEDDKFLSKLDIIMKINLVIQLVIDILGKGRMYGTSRYMGTFNDPNQFGYFVLLTYSFIYLLGYKFKRNSFVFLLIAIYLIAESVSTGMLLGIALFIALDAVQIVQQLPNYIKNHSSQICFFLMGLIVFVSVFSVMSVLGVKITDNLLERLNVDFIVKRIEGKFNKAEKENGNLLQERGYDRIKYYPQYVLYGAGEGYFKRWELAYHQAEFHATFPSILFNYGIVPLFILFGWIYSNLKHLKMKYLIVYFALFIESFTLLNSRQALFWIIILLGGTMSSEMSRTSKKTEIVKN